MPEAEATFRGELVMVRMKRTHTILGRCCIHCMLYLVYAEFGVCCIWCMLYLLYAVFGVCCIRCMLYSLYAVFAVCCIRCMLYTVLTDDYDMERERGMT